MGLSDFTATAGNWRQQLRDNERKTKIVIATFIALYLAVGLLVDVVIAQSQYQASLTSLLWAFLSLRLFPYATVIMAVIAGVSLLVTYAMYDKIMLLGTDYHEISPESARDLNEKQLYNVVEEMKVASGLQYMPKVYLIEADYMNAFASGYSEKSAMVAITRGLMSKLNRAEIQAVMAHELSHIRHHDIKLTLTVSVLSNIMLLVIDLLFYNALFSRRQRNQDNRLLMVIIVLRYVLPLITVLLTLFLSRTREYMADAGSVELMRDNEPMARALLKINGDHKNHAEQYAKQYGRTAHEDMRRASYIFDPAGFDPVKSLTNAFSTHPSIDKRLKALGYSRRQ